MKDRILGGKLLRLYMAIILLASSFHHSLAQVSTASVKGVVHDAMGAVVPGAGLSLTNVDTAVEKTTVSNDAGAYIFVSIAPGRYTLQAKASGFDVSRVPTFTLTVGQSATIDLSLKIGTQSSVVTVEGAAPLLDVSSANLGTLIGHDQVNDLPLNGRNFTQLLTLTPGASPVSVGQNANGGWDTVAAKNASVNFPSINGQSNRSNYFLTDGLNNNEVALNTYAVPPIPDEIQEFKVVSHADSAEYGGVIGGVVNVVTLSGTNKFHGGAWDYSRNTIFDARTYFLPTTLAKPQYNQNMYGGTLGGPVVLPKLYNGHDKTFFFVAYQGFHFNEDVDTLVTGPTTAQLSGDESSWPTQIYNPFSTRPDPANPGNFIRDPYPGNQIPVNPEMVAWAKFVYPVTTNANGESTDTTPDIQTQNQYTVRLDQKIGKNDTAFFRYSAFFSNEDSSGGLPTIEYLANFHSNDWGASYVHVFNPSLILEGQFSHALVSTPFYYKFRSSTTDIISQVGFESSFVGDYLANNGKNLFPGPSVPGWAAVNEAADDFVESSLNNEFGVHLTKSKKTHVMDFGVQYISAAQDTPTGQISVGFSATQTADTNPSDSVNSGDPLASFLLNVPDSATRRNQVDTNRPGGVFSIYGQDSWRATDKLTLNYGLRYDVTFIPPYGTNATIGKQGGIETGDMDFTNGTYILQKVPPTCAVRGYAPCIPGDGTLPTGVVVDPRGKIAYNAYDNFGPRVGFAYHALSRSVIHGAFGIVYDNWAAVLQQSQNNGGAWPDIGSQTVVNLNNPSTASPTPTATSQNPLASLGIGLFPAATPFSQDAYFYDPHKKNPMSSQWSFGIEQLLTPSTSMVINYVGSYTKRTDIGGFYNTALTPGPGDPQARAAFPNISATNYDRSAPPNGGPSYSSNYNALQVLVQQRLSHGLYYSAAYTWSKVIDMGGDGWFGVEGSAGSTSPIDPYNPSLYDRSVAGYNLTHIFSGTLIYELPFGKGKQFATSRRIWDYIIGNWQINNIFSAHSGIPFTPYISSDIPNTGNISGDHLNRIGDPNQGALRTPYGWFNPAAYAVPSLYTYGDAGRNSLEGPAYWNLDSSLFREFPVGGGRRIQFRGEAFNVLNHPALGQPINDWNTGTEFGKIYSTANAARILQVSVKYLF